MADRVVTVAPSYRDEIMTLEGAWGMHDVRPRAQSYSPRRHATRAHILALAPHTAPGVPEALARA